jgi:GntR family transcriptional regulator
MSQVIDSESHARTGLPLHRRVYLVVRDGINRGEYAAGSALPPEGVLARRFKVSRITVRTALAALEAEGLIDRQQGRGTFVNNLPTVAPLASSMADLVAHMRDVSKHTEVTVVEFDYGPLPLSVRARLDSPPTGAYQRAVRVRSLNRKPQLHITTYIPEHLGRTYTRDELATTPLYDLLRRSDVEFHSGQQVVTAVAADLAVAELLGLEVGEPLILVRRTHLDADGRFVEYLEMLASPSSFELRTALGTADGIG